MAATTLPDSPGTVRYRWGRRIGPWGSTTRAVLGAGSVAWALAVAHDHPAGNIAAAHAVVERPARPGHHPRRRDRRAADAGPGRGAVARRKRGRICATAALVAVAQVIPVAILLFIGITMLIQAGRGADGCELLEIPNVLLRRHDRLLACRSRPSTSLKPDDTRRATAETALADLRGAAHASSRPGRLSAWLAGTWSLPTARHSRSSQTANASWCRGIRRRRRRTARLDDAGKLWSVAAAARLRRGCVRGPRSRVSSPRPAIFRIWPMSSNGMVNTSWNTNATRWAGDRRSRTTSIAEGFSTWRRGRR